MFVDAQFKSTAAAYARMHSGKKIQKKCAIFSPFGLELIGKNYGNFIVSTFIKNEKCSVPITYELICNQSIRMIFNNKILRSFVNVKINNITIKEHVLINYLLFKQNYSVHQNQDTHLLVLSSCGRNALSATLPIHRR